MAVVTLCRPPLLDHSHTSLGVAGSPARGNILYDDNAGNWVGNIIQLIGKLPNFDVILMRAIMRNDELMRRAPVFL